MLSMINDLKITLAAFIGVSQGFIENINPFLQFLIGCASLFYIVQKGIKVKKENKKLK